MAIAPSDIELAASSQSQGDPYRYGWRYVRRQLPDGGEVLDQVPLTLEDVLYPEVEDFHVHSKAHEDTCTYLSNVFNAYLKDDPTAVVLDDVRVAWDVPGLRPNGPDIAVIRGVREQRNWSTFDVAEEGVRPAVIIEITSPETRSNDLIDKVEIYAQAGIPLYIIADTRRWKGQETLYLLGYQLTLHGFEVLAPDQRGWYWIEVVGVWLGLHDNRVMCFDLAGNPIGNYAEVEAARTAAETRAADAETRAADAETHAAAEAAARAQAEVRMRELEAELRRLRGEA
jgi:Uma2 family endonuclease